MTEQARKYGSQPKPTKNDRQRTVDLVVEDIKERAEFGLGKYGTYLQPGNGRNSLQDAYEEALDLALYLRTEIENKAGRIAQNGVDDVLRELMISIAEAFERINKIESTLEKWTGDGK